MAGCTTGAMAVALAQPTDVVKVRFQAQVREADGVKRYSGTIDAYKTIARDEGVKGLWKGENITILPFILSFFCSSVELLQYILPHNNDIIEFHQ